MANSSKVWQFTVLFSYTDDVLAWINVITLDWDIFAEVEKVHKPVSLAARNFWASWYLARQLKVSKVKMVVSLQQRIKIW